MEDAPDLGGPVPHATAGVSVVGARDILIAYNINLDTTDVKLARRIAKRVREELPKVRAIGWYQAAFGCAQVSLNLLDYRVTDLGAAFAKTGEVARELGIGVTGSEMIGLAVEEAMGGWEGLGLGSVREFEYSKRVIETLLATEENEIARMEAEKKNFK